MAQRKMNGGFGFVFVMIVAFIAAPIVVSGSEKPCSFDTGEPAHIKAGWPSGPGYQGSTCTYDWVELEGIGTELYFQDDSTNGPYPIGFDFNFYGETWPELYVGSNGLVSFGRGRSNNYNECPMGLADGVTDVIAPQWDDFDPGDLATPIYYHSFDPCPVGSGRCFVVQWEDICLYPGGENCESGGTFEVLLYDDDTIVFQYEDAGVNQGDSSTTGIVGDDIAADHSLTYACNTADSITDGLCLQIEPNGFLFAYGVAGVAHANGSGGTVWRSNLAAANRSGGRANAMMRYYMGGGNHIDMLVTVEDGEIREWEDIADSLFNASGETSGSIIVESDRPLFITARTFNQGPTGTFGQFLPGVDADVGISPGEIGLLSHLKSNPNFRTNIGFVNLSVDSCAVSAQLYDSSGQMLGSLIEGSVPGREWRQFNRVFAGLGHHDIAYALVHNNTEGCQVWAYASVVDEDTGDPTTVPVTMLP